MLNLIRIIFILLGVGLIITWSVVFIADIFFNQKVKQEVKELFESDSEKQQAVITKADLAGLPQSVQRWLEYSQVLGKERISTVRLKQTGLMRMKEGQPWMPSEAVQYFTIDKPGFIWQVKVKMAPLVYFTGRDKYVEGKGSMLIKVFSLFPVVNATGKEMDQGTLLRYLAEMPWFPTAALSSYIKWGEIDANSARATMSYQGVTASAVFKFNEQGELLSFEAKRYKETDGKYVLEDWSGLTKAYQEFNGFRIPSQTDVSWKLKTGDFNWFQCEIMEIEYNKPMVY